MSGHPSSSSQSLADVAAAEQQRLLASFNARRGQLQQQLANNLKVNQISKTCINTCLYSIDFNGSPLNPTFDPEHPNPDVKKSFIPFFNDVELDGDIQPRSSNGFISSSQFRCLKQCTRRSLEVKILVDRSLEPNNDSQ